MKHLSKPNIGIERTVKSHFPVSYDEAWPAAFFSLVGMALGDSLGAPLEMKSFDDIEDMWSLDSNYPTSLMPCGLIYTDDTQMSLSIIDCILKHKGVDKHYLKSLWVDLSKQQWFEDAGQKLSGPYQFGGFRGTGSGFRQTVSNLQLNIAADESTMSAGNGAAIRVTPLAIWAYHGGKMKEEERVKKLANLVLDTATITHHSVLGIAPAFSLAYMLMKWLRVVGADAIPFSDLPVNEQLDDIATRTKWFEESFLNTPFFSQKSGYSPKTLHSYSNFLFKLAKMQDIWQTDPCSALAKLNDLIVKYAERFSVNPKTGYPRPLNTMNDGMAIASTTAAISAALLFKGQPLLPVLQHVYYYGGDTDSVGAMLGSLLGAYMGRSNTKIAEDLCCQLICAENLFDCFRMFVRQTLGRDGNINTQFDFVHQEHLVTKSILDVPNRQRNPHYNSHYARAPVLADPYADVQREVERLLYAYTSKDKFDELTTMFTHIYGKVFMSELILEKASNLSADARMNIFRNAWQMIIVPAHTK